MAWVKIPAENHPVFLAALPKDRRVSTLKMFGGLAGIVNGHMFCGLFGRSFMVKLSETDQKAALELDGAEPFDPMGTGAVMKDSIFMPEPVLDEASELRDWLHRAFQYTATLPPKVKKAKPATKKPAAKKSPAKKSPAKKSPAKKSPAKKSKR